MHKSDDDRCYKRLTSRMAQKVIGLLRISKDVEKGKLARTGGRPSRRSQGDETDTRTGQATMNSQGISDLQVLCKQVLAMGRDDNALAGTAHFPPDKSKNMRFV